MADDVRLAAKPEPPPVPNDSTPIWELVIADMKECDHLGREKYGTPLQAGNKRDALVDAYQEILDAAVYLRQAIEGRKGPRHRERRPHDKAEHEGDSVPCFGFDSDLGCDGAVDGSQWFGRYGGRPLCPQCAGRADAERKRMNWLSR